VQRHVAGASVDTELDDADREAGRPVACPVLVPWAGPGRAGPLLWRRARGQAAVGPRCRGRSGRRSHFLADDRPEGDCGGAARARVTTYPVDIALRAYSTGAAGSGARLVVELLLRLI
jgi:hypothetical protein